MISVDVRYGDGWRPVTAATTHTLPGPAEIRFVFSKPVRRQEVERVLLEAQAGPVRGLMQWQDDRTLYWQIAELPPRLDLLLHGASDQEGVPLPGGIPSLRVGGPPILVEVNLAEPGDQVRAELPADIVSATLTPDGAHINLLAWTPGATQWDWQTVDFHLTLAGRSLKPGRADGTQPRVTGDLESWVTSPNGSAIAGLRTEQRPGPSAEPYRADLIVMDLRGGRRAVYERFISRFLGSTQADLTTHLAWSADSQRIAALSYTDPADKSADLTALDLPTGARVTLMEAVPVSPAGTRLAWSPNERYMLAGNLLLDLETQSHTVLEGFSNQARGVWEPESARLLYSAEDWGAVFVVNAANGDIKPLGSGFIVGWQPIGRAYMVRWPASGTRYQPPGM